MSTNSQIRRELEEVRDSLENTLNYVKTAISDLLQGCPADAFEEVQQALGHLDGLEEKLEVAADDLEPCLEDENESE